MSYIPGNIRSGSVSSSGTISSSRFLGIDGSAAQNSISAARADGKSYYEGMETAGSVNMIRSALGEVSKRAGYTINAGLTFMNDIGGVHVFKDPDGDKFFYVFNKKIYLVEGTIAVKTLHCILDFTDCRSIQADRKMFFLCGNGIAVYNIDTEEFLYIRYDGACNITQDHSAYIPTTFIACSPSGAGVSYEPVNMFSPYVAEQYIPDGTSNTYITHFEIEGDVTVFIRDPLTMEWGPKEYDYASKNSVSFSKAPYTHSTGEDMLRIVYKRKNFAEGAARLSGCKCGTMYGLSGYKDRVFLSANDSLPGYVFYSDMDNPLYFPDLNYIRVGSVDTLVRGLAGQDTDLAVICTDNVYTVTGNTVNLSENGNASTVFTVSGIFKTPAPAGVVDTAVFDGEVVYLTESGVCAISASGVLDERFCQIRSTFINYHLQKEELSDCKLLVTDEFLIISNRRGRLYILDSKQFSTAGDLPFSHRQYEGYIWEKVPAKHLWVQNDCVHFSDGTLVYRFNKGFEANNEYHDETSLTDNTVQTESITAYWETPYIYCTKFHLNKFFTRLGVLLDSKYGTDGAPLNTDIKILAKFDNDDWRVIKDYDGSRSVFRYLSINYNRFTYSNKPKSYAIYKRLLHKKGRAIKLRFENSNYDEPFTLQEFSVEYNIM